MIQYKNCNLIIQFFIVSANINFIKESRTMNSLNLVTTAAQKVSK